MRVSETVSERKQDKIELKKHEMILAFARNPP